MTTNVNSNNNNTRITNNFQLNINIGGQQSNTAASVTKAKQTLSAPLDLVDHRRTDSGSSSKIPNSAYVPPPIVGASGAPAGKGLSTDPQQGWPKDTVKTAGGYRVVPEGNTNWSIYAPGQKHGEKAHTRVWGDPHVTEKDGTRWDFTKDSDFVLPDGTRIFADTDYDKKRGNGQSVTRRLMITNGQDRVEIDGIANRKGQQKVSNVKHDAYEWRAMHLTNPEANKSNKYGQSEGKHDEFHLTGDKNNVHWVRERDGKIDGVIKGTKRVRDGNVSIYDQKIDPTLNPTTARELRPPIGSRAWGNQIRSEVNDAQAKASRQVFGKNWGSLNALNNAYGIHADHINGHIKSDVADWLFGGLPSYFNDYRPAFGAINGMVDLLKSDSQWRRQFQFGQLELTSWT